MNISSAEKVARTCFFKSGAGIQAPCALIGRTDYKAHTFMSLIGCTSSDRFDQPSGYPLSPPGRINT